MTINQIIIFVVITAIIPLSLINIYFNLPFHISFPVAVLVGYTWRTWLPWIINDLRICVDLILLLKGK